MNNISLPMEAWVEICAMMVDVPKAEGMLSWCRNLWRYWKCWPRR
jgi:hypothetical protein